MALDISGIKPQCAAAQPFLPFHARRVQKIEVRNGKQNKTPSDKSPFHEP